MQKQPEGGFAPSGGATAVVWPTRHSDSVVCQGKSHEIGGRNYDPRFEISCDMIPLIISLAVLSGGTPQARHIQ